MWKFEPTMNSAAKGAERAYEATAFDGDAFHHPIAAHAATGEGEDYSSNRIDGTGIVRAVVWGLVSWLAVAMCAAIVIGAH